MKNEIVKDYYGEGRAGTFLIAQGFGREHKRVVDLILKYKKRFLRLEDNKSFLDRLIIQKVPAKKAGRPVKEYLLNEAQTIFLGSIFRNTDIVLDFKERLAREFINLKKQNEVLKKYKGKPVYKIARNAGKILRLESTNVMQEFVEYAKSQGSTNPDKYYMLYTKLVNGLLFIVEGKFKNLRDVMSTPQLMTTGAADQVVTKGISDGMKNKVFYKDIYKDVKSRVISFADLTGQSKVIEDCLQLELF